MPLRTPAERTRSFNYGRLQLPCKVAHIGIGCDKLASTAKPNPTQGLGIAVTQFQLRAVAVHYDGIDGQLSFVQMKPQLKPRLMSQFFSHCVTGP